MKLLFLKAIAEEYFMENLISIHQRGGLSGAPRPPYSQPQHHVVPTNMTFDVEERASFPCRISTWSGVQRRSCEI